MVVVVMMVVMVVVMVVVVVASSEFPTNTLRAKEADSQSRETRMSNVLPLRSNRQDGSILPSNSVPNFELVHDGISKAAGREGKGREGRKGKKKCSCRCEG